jgi:regulator of replication initiation timing
MAEHRVLPLNFTAMKCLLTENRRLRERLDAEKTKLSSVIDGLTAHLGMTEKLFRFNRIPVELYQRLMSVSGALDGTKLKPSITFRRASAEDVTDLSETVKEKQAQFEQLQKEVLELSQERTMLALEEQKVNAARSNSLQDLTSARRTCDELILTKEKFVVITHDH